MQRSVPTRRWRISPRGRMGLRHSKRRGVRAAAVLVGALLWLVAFGPIPAAPEEPPSPAERLERVEEALDRGNSSRAYELLGTTDWNVTELEVEELARLAELDLQLWRYGLAVRIARLALERHPRPPAPARNETDPLIRRMNRVLAIALYSTARGGGPTPELQRLDRTTALDTSASLLRDLIEAPEGDPHDRFWLAAVLTERREWKAAQAVLDRYLESVPSGERLSDTERLRSCLRFRLGDEAVETVGVGIEAPRKIESPAPHYTDAARHAGIEGAVTILAVIDEKGRVVCPRPLQGLPLGLTEIAVRTLFTWRFEPATLDGEPVPVYYNVTFNFNLGADSGGV